MTLKQEYEVCTFREKEKKSYLHVPMCEREYIKGILFRYGLDKFYSMEYFYTKWKLYSRLQGVEWKDVTKEQIEFVFSIELRQKT